MKVLNLRCAHEHVFEGWFASEEDFMAQQARGLIECPVCTDKAISKMPSAPRLNLGAAPSDTTAQAQNVAPESPAAAQHKRALHALREWMSQTEDVGERFAEEARKIHYGEADERSIRGQASSQEVESLLDEGVPVLPLIVPRGLKGPLH